MQMKYYEYNYYEVVSETPLTSRQARLQHVQKY